MTKVKVCIVRNLREQIIEIEGEDYGIVTVAPILDRNLRPHHGIYAVRSTEDGIRIATFTKKHVAQNFAKRINGYGERLRIAMYNSARYAETAEDTKLIDEIDAMSEHPTRRRTNNNFATKKSIVEHKAQ